jgi:hypothetical protein
MLANVVRKVKRVHRVRGGRKERRETLDRGVIRVKQGRRVSRGHRASKDKKVNVVLRANPELLVPQVKTEAMPSLGKN